MRIPIERTYLYNLQQDRCYEIHVESPSEMEKIVQILLQTKIEGTTHPQILEKVSVRIKNQPKNHWVNQNGNRQLEKQYSFMCGSF